jgi:hypothetical protein
MAIGFVCPDCGGRLRVPDQWARMRVACPDCRALLRAPAPEGAEPVEAVPVAESLAPGKAAVRDHHINTSPPAAADNHFTFHEPTADAAVAAPAGVIRTPGRAAGSRVEWAAFGSGCALARVGIWLEFAAAASLLGPLLALVVSLWAGARWWEGVVAKVGPFGLLPFLGLMLVGAALVGVGRLRMRAVPAGTGAGGVLTGTVVLSAVRVVALTAGVGLAAAAGFEAKADRAAGAALYLLYAFGGYAVALVAGVVADVTALPGLAVVGGAIPSTPLRRRVGLAAFVFQLVALLTVFQLAIGYALFLSAAQSGLTGRLGGGSRRPHPPAEARTESVESDSTSVAFAAACGLILFALLSRAGYAALHDSLYAAGQKATARDAPKEDGGADPKPA